MSFPENIREAVLLASGRHCCLCHRFCGLKIELHHIKPQVEGGRDTFDNCIPLCFDCHADMRSYDHKHPKGTKYSEEELKKHRDNWYAKVKSSPAISASSDNIELDKQTYQKIREILAWDGVIFFMKHHPFGASFYYDEIKPLYDFKWQCEDPGFEFLDADLESARANLLSSINRFLRHIGLHIWVMEARPDKLSVPHKFTVDKEEEWDRIVNEIDKDSVKVVEKYEALVKLARRKLGV